MQAFYDIYFSTKRTTPLEVILLISTSGNQRVNPEDLERTQHLYPVPGYLSYLVKSKSVRLNSPCLG